MFCNFSGITSLPSYAFAAQYFNEMPRPHNKTRGTPVWDDSARPLDGKLKPHLRVERHVRDGLETFSLCLYRTEMVRYYPPGEDGFARVLIHTDDRNASSQFMWRSGWSTTGIRRYDPARGCDVIIPLTRNKAYADGFWSADLWLRQGAVDVARSWHVPMAHRRTSSERKRERREALKPVEHILRFAAQAASPEWRGTKYISQEQAHMALGGDTCAQALLMEWALSENTSDLRMLKDKLLSVLRLPVLDERVPLPLFVPETELPCNVKVLVAAE